MQLQPLIPSAKFSLRRFPQIMHELKCRQAIAWETIGTQYILAMRDIADLKEIMSVGGSAFIARGRATGENRAEKAAELATISKKLGASIAEAKGVLVQIRGGRDLSLLEVEAAAAYVRNQMDRNIEFTMGAVMDPELGPELQVSLIATGMQRELPYLPMPAAPSPTVSEERGRGTGRYQRTPIHTRAYLT